MKKLIMAGAMVAATTTSALANCGGASWYALHSRTASGERMNPNHLTAAHRSIRFGTRVSVTNMRNGKSVVVKINDRGPFIRGRIIDLSRAAALQIGMLGSGTSKVCLNYSGKQPAKKAHINILDYLRKTHRPE